MVTRRQAALDPTRYRALIAIGRADRRSIRVKIAAPLTVRSTGWGPRRPPIIALHAQNPTGPRIGIEPKDAAVGR